MPAEFPTGVSAAGDWHLISVKSSASSNYRVRQVLELLHCPHGLECQIVDVAGVQARTFLERVFGDRRQELLELLLHGHEQPYIVAVPPDVQLCWA